MRTTLQPRTPLAALDSHIAGQMPQIEFEARPEPSGPRLNSKLHIEAADVQLQPLNNQLAIPSVRVSERSFKYNLENLACSCGTWDASFAPPIAKGTPREL